MAYPSYIDAYKRGELQKKALDAAKFLENCVICPRRCHVNRAKDLRGFCKTGKKAAVYSYFAHHGEEPPISGTKGSGAIFFSHCNMRCVYCQNYEFSQIKEGKEATSSELASYMLELQKEGCHNINLITPTHVMPQILEALIIAIENGLKIPLVYNTSGYELPEIIKLLDGIIDIYLADMRYSDNKYAISYSKAANYPKHNQQSIKEMFKQVGETKFDEDENITRGLIIRHLVLPNDISSTEEIFKFITHELSAQVYISLMSQYHPCFEAFQNPPLNRELTLEEYENAENLMKKYGLHNGWVQESGGLKRFAGTNIKRNI